MQNSKHPASTDQFDQIVIGRILAEDFGQPQIKDAALPRQMHSSMLQRTTSSLISLKRPNGWMILLRRCAHSKLRSRHETNSNAAKHCA